jgi:cytochrome c oxidase assembly protein subunit 15
MLFQLAALGVLVAMLPLTVVWVSKDSNKYRKLVWVTLFLTFDLIMFGAFTRLTDSGLGCPDWPGCYGHANPFAAHAEISAAEAAMPTGPVTVVKAWIEMIHRYLAMAVGVLIIAITIAAWRRWRATRSGEQTRSPWLPTSLLVFVCLQGAFGAWTVTMKLQPVIAGFARLAGGRAAGFLSLVAGGDGLARTRRSGAAAGLCPDRPGRLGQHQLCNAGMRRLSFVPWTSAAANGFRARFYALARARHDRER